MGTVVTVMNMKGGVGKTTVCMHLAGALARYKLGSAPLKVLAIDYDPQFNLSQAMLPAKRYFDLEKKRKTTISILLDDDSGINPYEITVPGNHTPPAVADLVANTTLSPRLDMIPSTLDLMYVALGQANGTPKPIEERFQKFIAECRKQYDVIFIDCHPAGSLFTKTSLSNSDHVLIPVVPQRYAVRGIGLMMQFIQAKATGSAPTPHILFNRTARFGGPSTQEAEIRANKQFSKHCMTHTFKQFKVFSQPEQGADFVWSSGAPYSTEAFNNLIDVGKEFKMRIGA